MPVLRLAFCVALFALSLLPDPSEAPRAASFTRSGADQLEAASLASGESLSFSYDASHGQMTEIAGENGLSLKLESDTLLHLPVSQSVEESGDILLSAAITYEAGGLRASRIVSAGSQGSGSSITSYWYGGGLHPLVITRDGVTYRLIGKGVVEAIDASGPTRTYLQADHLGSVRMATNDQGHVVQSLSYDDYGFTRIQGQSAAASFDSMASFYRFQGQEQEVFPLAKLSIDDSALAAWLDQLQLYHFPWRDYAAGLAAFTQTDLVPTGDSLYAAFAANPVNYTDETGGMIGILANISSETQQLLDLITEGRGAQLSSPQRTLLTSLLDQVRSEDYRTAINIYYRARERLRLQTELEVFQAEQTIIRRLLIENPHRNFSDSDRQTFKTVAHDIVEHRVSKQRQFLSWELMRVARTVRPYTGPMGEVFYEQDRRRWLDRYSDLIENLREDAITPSSEVWIDFPEVEEKYRVVQEEDGRIAFYFDDDAQEQGPASMIDDEPQASDALTQREQPRPDVSEHAEEKEEHEEKEAERKEEE